ncbi:MAG: (Fe-S)-binding protein, partial [Chromatiaceae bacterium]
PVGLASACVAELRGHPPLGATHDLCRLLADRDWPARVHMAPLPQRVAVHVPCSQRNRLGDEDAAFALLRRIPGISLVPLPDNAFCCGAAGTYLLQRPVLSRVLLAPKIASLAAIQAPILVTTNTGCALHLAAGAQEAGLQVEVLHPVELIDRQMRFT